MSENLLSTGRSTFAWGALIITITALAAGGILSEHGPTAAAILAAIAVVIGMWTALAALTSSKKKANMVLTVTAVLSASAALLVREADTIQGMVKDPEAENIIPAIILLFAAGLTYVIHRYNREDDQT